MGVDCQRAPVTISAKFNIGAEFNRRCRMAPCNGRAAKITPSLRDREGAYADLRLVYISMIPLATMTQAPARCWIGVDCQRAPVTIGAKFNIGAKFGRQCRRRALA
ncbi:hypothetical protein BZG81_14120 [Salinivibrio sp. MA607]|nr:hypothetical protein BZG81_14120 [Salinivibrio sp. MA607]